MKRANLKQRILLALTLVTTGATSFAEQVDSASADSDSIWMRDTLTGDRKSLRRSLKVAGIHE